MKLYSEKQIKETINLSRNAYKDGYPLSIEGIFKQLTPIELPSDEEIKEYFSWGYGGDGGSAIYGAKWMKEQILKQNK